MRTIECCRVCGSSELTGVLSLGEVHLSAFIADGQATVPSKYPLDLLLCADCKLVQLRHTVPAEEMYREYWYRSGTNASMTRELQSIAADASRFMTHGGIALDIGCNDGTLLGAYKSGIHTVGFEPAQNLVEHARKNANTVIGDFFSADAWRREMGSKRAQVVTSIAMFYDLDDPNSFVRDVNEVMAMDGRWIIQMADLKSMIERTMWDNICHEHLEYYSLTALENLLARHSFVVEHVAQNDVNGGSIRVRVAKRGYENVHGSVGLFREDEQAMLLDTPAPYAAFSARVREGNRQLVDFIHAAVAEGKTVCVYGASTKGNTLLQCTGLDHTLIKAAAERNPDKWGRFTVGTGIPIMSEDEVRAMKPDYMLVLPWHFLDEFIKREAEYLQSGGKFIVPLPEFRIVGA